MLFQTLDDKSECVGVYADGKLYFNLTDLPSDLSQTWSYVSYLRDTDTEYAALYLEGKEVGSILPEYLQDDWSDALKQMQSFKRSLITSKVSLQENCFFDLVPKRFLLEFCRVKNNITSYVFKKVERPRRYSFYHAVSQMLGDIAQREVKIDTRKLNSLDTPKLSRQIEKIKHSSKRVSYNQFGTKTGRLTTSSNSFPILTLNKDLRCAIYPTNDFFIEIDFNGAEVRTLLGLLQQEQPPEDIHDFHLENIFTHLSTRDQSKIAFFAWLYGSRDQSNVEAIKKLENYYDRQDLLRQYYRNNTITSPYGKTIVDVTPHHAINYLVQSTAAELTLKQALKVEYFLRSKRASSFLSFIIHDSIILDMRSEDLKYIEPIAHLMSSTNFGTFGINIKKGATLGTLERYENG
jgi:hypothetical protein